MPNRNLTDVGPLSLGCFVDSHADRNIGLQLEISSLQWGQDTKHDPAQVRGEIEQILQGKAWAPMYGLWGEKIVNVLEVNLELRKRYGAPPA